MTGLMVHINDWICLYEGNLKWYLVSENLDFNGGIKDFWFTKMIRF